MWKNCGKEGGVINQRSQTEGTLKRATYWMQEPTIQWLKWYARASGISQGALINAIILDFQLRKMDPSVTDAAKVASLRRYVDVLLGGTPPIKPALYYRVSR